MSLFQVGDFTLASGRSSHFKIDCDALTAADWAAVGFVLASLLPPFGRTLGVPEGGLALAEAMRRYEDEEGGQVLVVDDVWTTGGSAVRFAAENGLVDPLYAALFCRGHRNGVYALFTTLHPL